MPATDSFLLLAQCYAKDPAVSDALKTATLAQWILESGRGESELAREHCNFGGIKYRDRMAEFAVPVVHGGREPYCGFTDEEAFIKGYWHFIESGPYGGWTRFTDDSAGYINHICPGTGVFTRLGDTSSYESRSV